MIDVSPSRKPNLAALLWALGFHWNKEAEKIQTAIRKSGMTKPDWARNALISAARQSIYVSETFDAKRCMKDFTWSNALCACGAS